MNELTNVNDNESQSFVNMLIENIDFRTEIEIRSYFRSDFRGTKFKKVYFFKNNLDRSDFIDVIFDNVTFDTTNFGNCEVNNCLFINCTFTNNQFNSANIINCNFTNCSFVNENMMINISNCSFDNCNFDKSKFERSSFEDIHFNECMIKDCDMATMHAEYMFFNKCRVKNTFFGRDYWTTYFIKYTILEDIQLKYRGAKINLNEFELNADMYIDTLIQLKRYCEVLNLMIMSNKNTGIFRRNFHLVFKQLPNQENHIRKKQYKRILSMIDFYINSDMLSLIDLIWVVDYFNNYEWSRFSFEESISYRASVYIINEKLNNRDEDITNQSSEDLNTLTISKFHFKTDDREEAFNILETLFKNINKHNGLNGNKKLYKVINAEKGSWIITIASSLAVMMLVTRTLKTMINTSLDLKLSFSVHKKANEYIDKLTIKDRQEMIHLIELVRNQRDDNNSELLLSLEDIKKLKEVNIGINELVQISKNVIS